MAMFGAGLETLMDDYGILKRQLDCSKTEAAMVTFKSSNGGSYGELQHIKMTAQLLEN
jgi:hypothetical protein